MKMETLKRWMRDWKYPTSLLCIYGFFSTVRPYEPFLIPFLTGPDKNLTIEQVNNQIFPVWTYSYLAVLVPVFLLTEWLCYKPVVVFQCLVLFSTVAMLLWCNGVPEMQAIQFTAGMVTSCDVAYFTYLYSVVELKHYLKATSYCRTAQLLGNTVGSVLGQILVSFELMSYNYLLVFTLVLTTIALITSILLPMPKTSMFFHQIRSASGETDGEGHVGTDEELQNNGRKDGVELNGSKQLQQIPEGSSDSDNRSAKSSRTVMDYSYDVFNTFLDLDSVFYLAFYGTVTSLPVFIQNILNCVPKTNKAFTGLEQHGGGCGDVLLRLWWDFLQCFSSRTLLVWSVWWALATCGYNQTINYVQLLWEYVEPSSNFTVYNGGVEALSNLLGASAAYGISFSSTDWSRWGEVALGALSALEGGALFAMVFSANIWVCYCGYIIFKSLYMLLITIAMFQIAAGLNVKRYALVFGANTFCALVLQTIITSVMVDSSGLGVDIVTQFTVYGAYFSLIALIFFLRGLYTTMCRKPETETPRENPEETFKAEDDAQIIIGTKF